MKNKKINLNVTKINFLFLFIFSIISLFVSNNTVFAAQYGVTLTVSGGTNASVFNGESVNLEWFINAPNPSLITNCKITLNETLIQSIDTSVLPVSGSMTVLPPEDSDSNYLLKCDQNQSSVNVNTNLPFVSMNVTEGSNSATAPEVSSLQFNAITNHVKSVSGSNAIVRVNWTAVNSDRCSVISKKIASNASNIFVETNTSSEYTNLNGISGSVTYDGSPRSIQETTTFYITCYDDSTGNSYTASTTLNVTAPDSPQPITINLYVPPLPGGPTTIKQDLLYGYATTSVSFTSQNAAFCSQKAYYQDGTLYVKNPNGWGGNSTSDIVKTYPKVKLATSTVLSVTCSRNATTFNGVSYPATSTTKTLSINVIRPNGVGVGIWDRSTLEPVQVRVDSVSPVYKDALFGLASAYLTIVKWGGVDYCKIRTFKTKGTPDNYADDIEVTNIIPSGQDMLYGNGTTTLSLSGKLSESIRFSVYCAREYDEVWGTVAEKENGTEQVEKIIEVLEPLTVNAPVLNMYSHQYSYTGISMGATGKNVVGFQKIGSGITNLKYRAPANSLFNTVTVDYNGGSITGGAYDIVLQYCDEGDGEATYRIKVNDKLVSEIISDRPGGVSDCRGILKIEDYGIEKVQDYPLELGDEITIECEKEASSNESCEIRLMLISSNDVVTTQVNPVSETAIMPIKWTGTNLGYCEKYIATPNNNQPKYDWWNSASAVNGLKTLNISTSTVFTMQCGRYADNVKVYGTVTATVPYKPDLSAEVVVNVGQCKNDGSIEGYPIDSIINPTPRGYSPNESGYCEKLLDIKPSLWDLSYNDPAVEVDHENGVYKNVPVKFFIISLGKGGHLPEDEDIKYRFRINYDSGLNLPVNTSGPYVYRGGLERVGILHVTTSLLSAELTADIPFGRHEICIDINNFEDIYPESNTDNNTDCETFDIPPPEPPIYIFANEKESILIRRDQKVDVHWDHNVNYLLNCEVKGFGVSDVEFDTLNFDSDNNLVEVSDIKNRTEFKLICTEPITNSVFTKSAWVEVVPDVISN